MAKPTRQWQRIRRIQENLRLTRPIVVLAVGVLLPVLLSTSVGIVSLIMGESDADIVLGALTVITIGTLDDLAGLLLRGAGS